MNRKDFTIVILLALLIPVWMFIDRTFIAPKFLPSNNISKDVIHEPLPSKESSNLGTLLRKSKVAIGTLLTTC